MKCRKFVRTKKLGSSVLRLVIRTPVRNFLVHVVHTPDPVAVVESEFAGSGHCSDVGSVTELIVMDHAEVPRGWGRRHNNALDTCKSM